MKGVSFLPGAVLASLAIGPLVALGGVLVTVFSNSGGAGGLWAAPVVIVLAAPVGFVVSFLPNLLGAAALGWLGRGNIAGRLPVLWVLAGAGIGGAPVVALNPDVPAPEAVAVLAGIGALSALLCRWKTRWA